MEKNSNFVTKWAMTYGLYLGLFHIIFIIFLYLRGNIFDSKSYGYISMAFVIGIIWIGIVKYRDKVNKGFLTYGQGVGLGVLISVFGSIFAAATIYILMKLDTSLSIQRLTLLQEEAMKRGMPDEVLEKMEPWYTWWAKPFVVALSKLVNKIFLGTVFSLIIAAIVKRKPESGFYEAVKDIE